MKLQTIEEVVGQIQKSKVGTHDVLLKNPSDFHLESAGPEGYKLRLEGKAYKVGPIGMTSICRLLRMPKDYFDRFPRPEEFVEHAQTLLPRVCKDGVLVRLNGELRGVVPSNYRIFDDDQALSFIGDLAHRWLPHIRGVAVTSDRWDRSCYRILFGDSALAKDEIYPVVNFSNSEIGFSPLSMDAGTFRLVCLNGSMRPVSRGQRFRWNHTGDWQEKIDDLTAFLRCQARVASETAEAIRRAVDRVLPSGAEEIQRLNAARWITRSFSKEAQKALAPTDRTTKYDVFNAITNAAQGLRLPERLKTEAVAHAYLLSRN